MCPFRAKSSKPFVFPRNTVICQFLSVCPVGFVVTVHPNHHLTFSHNKQKSVTKLTGRICQKSGKTVFLSKTKVFEEVWLGGPTTCSPSASKRGFANEFFVEESSSSSFSASFLDGCSGIGALERGQQQLSNAPGGVKRSQKFDEKA